MKSLPVSRLAWLALGAALFILPGATPAFADGSCVPSHDGVCNGHPQCDPANKEKHCRDTLTPRNGYICECRTGKDMKSALRWGAQHNAVGQSPKPATTTRPPG